MPLKLKQISGFFTGYVRINAFTADGASDVATTAITTALSTAGRNGASVPLQVAASEDAIGVVATGNNRVEVYDAGTEAKLKDGNGNEIYGRLTQASGIYTLSYFSLAGGTETAYTGFSSKSIDFEFPYRFDLARLPADFAIAVRARNVNDDPASGGSIFHEQLTVSGTNTLAALTKTPSSTSSVVLYVNGEAVDSFGSGAAPFSVSGKTVTWNAANIYTLETTDRVIAQYQTNE